MSYADGHGVITSCNNLGYNYIYRYYLAFLFILKKKMRICKTHFFFTYEGNRDIFPAYTPPALK
jgi:hypothetical protein